MQDSSSRSTDTSPPQYGVCVPSHECTVLQTRLRVETSTTILQKQQSDPHWKLLTCTGPTGAPEESTITKGSRNWSETGFSGSPDFVRCAFTASTASVNVSGASPRMCACHPRSTMDQSACMHLKTLGKSPSQECRAFCEPRHTGAGSRALRSLVVAVACSLHAS